MAITDGFKKLSLGELFSKLHDSIVSFVKELGETIEANRSISQADIQTLRNFIRDKMERKEDTVENEKLLKLLNLFATEKVVLEILKDDADEWLEFLQAIREYVDEGKIELSDRERKEIDKLTNDISKYLRK